MSRTRTALKLACCLTLAVAALPMFVGPAGAQPNDAAAISEAGGVPRDAQVARVVESSAAPIEISKELYFEGADKQGVSLSKEDKAAVAAARVTCWRWSHSYTFENFWGKDLAKSHHRVNWCGNGKWIRRHAYTERWGTTHWPGWNYDGVTSKSNKHGVNWNVYNSTTQNKFCYISIKGCVQQWNPYHSTWVGANGAAGSK